MVSKVSLQVLVQTLSLQTTYRCRATPSLRCLEISSLN
nr:MAG TPA: hypothetical protein [Caudoviricetes sp.]